MKSSLFRKVILPSLVLWAVIISVLYFVLITHTRESFEKSAFRSAEKCYSALWKAAETISQEGMDEGFAEVISNLKLPPQIRTVLRKAPLGEDLRPFHEKKRPLKEFTFLTSRYKFNVKVYPDLFYLKKLERETKKVFAIIALFSLFFLLTAIMFLFRWYSTYFSPLSQAISHAIEGKKSRVFFEGGVDVKEMSGKFNQLVYSFERCREEADILEQRMKVLIDNITDAVFIVDSRGYVTAWNHIFEMYVKKNVQKGSPYWMLLDIPDLQMGVTECLAGLSAQEGEFEDHGRFYRFRVVPFYSGGCAVIIQDITAEVHSSRVKRELVENIAHELKTPLTAIKGYAEVLSDSLSGELWNYSEIIIKHINRLSRILDDLVKLSMLEGDFEIQKEEVNVSEVVEKVIELYTPRAREKGISLVKDVEGNLFITGDGFIFEQIAINLVDNAIRYTDEGTVNVSLKREENKIVLEVKDTGIGIPRSHLERIFERFYVVDPSRSRSTGGTGLGLSIVKHAVMRLGGEINVTSELGRGSTFRVVIPVKTPV